LTLGVLVGRVVLGLGPVGLALGVVLGATLGAKLGLGTAIQYKALTVLHCWVPKVNLARLACPIPIEKLFALEPEVQFWQLFVGSGAPLAAQPVIASPPIYPLTSSSPSANENIWLLSAAYILPLIRSIGTPLGSLSVIFVIPA